MESPKRRQMLPQAGREHQKVECILGILFNAVTLVPTTKENSEALNQAMHYEAS